MPQNAVNQRSLAFLDQKIAIIYNCKALQVKFTFKEKLQLNKLRKNNNYSIIMLNLFLCFVILSC